MYPILKIMHILNFLGTFSVGVTTEIQTNFGRSCTFLEHRYKDNILYYVLEGYVSRATLSFIF